MNFLYVLDINPFISHILYKYFLPFSRKSLPFVDGFLCSEKAFKFNYNLICLFFAFIYFTLRNLSKRILLQFMSKSISSVISPRSCMVLGLIFRSLNHLSLFLQMV